MIGIFVLAVGVVWVGILVALAWSIGKRVRYPFGPLLGMLLFFGLLPLPIADEIIGRFQFRELCEVSATLSIDASRVRGRTLKRVATQSFITDGLLTIEQWDNRFLDAESGEELAAYKWLRSGGGLLARTFLDSGKPISFGPSTCAPSLDEPIEKVYGFTLITK